MDHGKRGRKKVMDEASIFRLPAAGSAALPVVKKGIQPGNELFLLLLLLFCSSDSLVVLLDLSLTAGLISRFDCPPHSRP